jgi:choline kinase
VSLALCREAVADRAFFKLDGDVVFESQVLSRLDACSAALAVAVDAGRMLDAEAMKVSVVGDEISAFGKGISLADSAGESIGIERIHRDFAGTLFDALDDTIRAGRRDRYYEDVYSDLIAAGKVRATAVAVSDLPWTEVDTFEDLERARGLIRQSAQL